ncbi:hypothetical protein DSCO28_07760 [Desulfosarcina ovata subsp. sediminis]|uniref:Uncharacterized protein n=1 Tax=Desulfosarcina ovata subsp. sediminis TaxID=885957 RepID=A0A5K7ZNL2_9BACT|nr:hypothetical protein [Desulfosarcina ovata]BBO80210.1 hypothetical protein DSCO28_07760 [Desulfosarcina ovata subsp. sediminis]
MKGTAIMLTFFFSVLFSLTAYAQLPYDVERSIKDTAANEHPGNYSLQNFEIKRQTKAYNDFESWEYEKNMDQRTFDDLKETVINEHPGNYALQLFDLKRQVAAYHFLQKYDYVDGVPYDVLNDLKYDVAYRHPTNFALQKFELQRQIKAYLDMH